MYGDLPRHLQALNTIPSSSPPSSALSAEQEEAFWSFMHTDELFSNFGLAPSAFESKLESERSKQAATASAETPAAETPASSTDSKSADHPTLESFLATFADESGAAPALPTNYLLAIPSYASSSSDSAPTPAATPDTTEFDEPERITGAKRLKQMGAAPAEIEEDKRRRNTEASARFRAKKKEREQALEFRAKELEAQVATLTAEKASLEKENNLLKFIVVNGNGGAGAPVQGADGLQAALAALGKRKREE
ncbi:hypothetical protein VHUM_01505 [Vanrija humicola]|uniref:BZIP domain-containing protein n=1 Tax=Vanrija humicola TaxID=5417 RepID=A0A7D8V0T8_VANHU|nr:hypothetical protein VHUM_01505 [Vanrija humicola]